MSASRTTRFTSQAEARSAGWFSRRHQTNEAHSAAVQERAAKTSAQRREADCVQLGAESRTPEQQLAKLDARLGKGVGATRERAKLLKEIANGRLKVIKSAHKAIGVARGQA